MRGHTAVIPPDPLPTGSWRALLQGLAQVHPLVLAVDTSRRVVWMSDELGLIYAGSGRLIGRPVEELLDEVRGTDRDAFRERIGRFIDEIRRTGRVVHARFDLETSTEPLPLEVRAFRVEDDSDGAIFVCIAQRVQRVAPLTVRHAPIDPESELAFILDSTPDGVITVDRLGFVTCANAAAGAFLGHSPDELIDHPLSRFVTDSDRAKQLAARLLENGELESAEIEITRADGARAWLSVSARTRVLPFRPQTGPQTPAETTAEIESGEASQAVTVVFLRDVTERHEARKELEKKNDELENYVRSVSHDLRSPLVSLLGFTRLLRDDYRDTLASTGLHFLDRIEQAGRHMEQLLHDMLELSRISAAPRYLVQVDPRPVLLQLEAELKLRLDEKHIELSIPDHPPTIRCDRTRLYQLFSNLVGNAIQHMHRDPETHPDEEPGRIRVEIESLDNAWRISVTDNGPGIAPTDQQRIFEMFQTAGRGGETKRSSGLGLAIVKKIVETHGGRVWVESELGQGARFLVHLPKT